MLISLKAASRNLIFLDTTWHQRYSQYIKLGSRVPRPSPGEGNSPFMHFVCPDIRSGSEHDIVKNVVVISMEY